ncbi:MAG: YqaJ viral recombinase family protein [Clostridia bacterium]|nr:YqaJ viral recombinase family protein [Clostridia bacterium]
MITRISTANREEWKALRSKYIGGSDAAAVVGLNHFSSPYALWAEKTGKTPPFEGNLTTDVGTYLEDFIAKRFESESGKKVRRANQSFINDRYPWAIANIDRDIVGEDSGLECKSTSALNTKRFRGGEFPTNYYCQCVHYLAVTEKTRWYLAVLIGNHDFKIYQLTRSERDTCPEWCESSVYISDEEITALMTAEDVFWNDYVIKDVPPSPDGSRSCTDAINTVYSESSDECVSLFAYAADLEQRNQINFQIKDLERIRDEIDNRIKTFMGDAGHGECDSYKVTWASSERKTFDSKRFAKDYAALDLSAYYKTSSYRTFKVTKIKEK